MMLIYHGRAEGNTTNPAEGHKEALHRAMSISQIMGMSRGPVV